jgi:hypothetical protein
MGLYWRAESSMRRISPWRSTTSALGSTSALEPASSNLGRQTRYFRRTGPTTEETRPGDTAASCNKQEFQSLVTSSSPWTDIESHSMNPRIERASPSSQYDAYRNLPQTGQEHRTRTRPPQWPTITFPYFLPSSRRRWLIRWLIHWLIQCQGQLLLPFSHF